VTVNGSNELLDDRPVLPLVIRDRVLIIEQVILLGIALDSSGYVDSHGLKDQWH
jgi:hypothetical protein